MEIPSEMVIVLKIIPLPPPGIHPFAGLLGKFVNVDVARSHLTPSRSHADLRLGKILFLKSDGIQHRTAWRAVGTIKH